MLHTHSLAGAEAVESAGAPPALRALPLFACVRSRAIAGAACVRLTGELDLAAARRLERTLRKAQAEASEVVVDLRDLTLVDCSGIGVIVDAAVRARRAGHRLTVVPGPAQVTRVFTLTGAADAVGMSVAAC
jgi:anti-sigma B factor antagonist